MRIERTVLGYLIWAEINKLDSGWDIGIYGGCGTHVGAVSLGEPSGMVETIKRLHHKDSYVSAQWAKELAKQTQEPVCVRCGIHYDNATKEKLTEIVNACDEILQQLCLVLEQGGVCK